MESLQICVEVFLSPLEQVVGTRNQIISPEQIKQVFSDIKIILSFNTKLLSELEPIVTKWFPYACFGNVFVSICQYLKVYTSYVQNYNSSLAVFNQLAKNKKFQKFLSAGKDHPRSKSRDLQSFLIQPVQRVPRYNLLLADLVKHTWNGHPDKSNLEKATEEIQRIATFLNEKKREAENMTKVYQIQEIISKTNEKFLLMQAGRTYLCEGDAYDKKEKMLSLYLFNNMLVVMNRKPKKDEKKSIYEDEERLKEIKFKEHFELNLDLHVDLLPSSECPPTFPFGIKVSFSKSDSSEFCFPQEKSRNEWKENFGKVLEKMNAAITNKENAKKVGITPLSPTEEEEPKEKISVEDQLYKLKMSRHISTSPSSSPTVLSRNSKNKDFEKSIEKSPRSTLQPAKEDSPQNSSKTPPTSPPTSPLDSDNSLTLSPQNPESASSTPAIEKVKNSEPKKITSPSVSPRSSPRKVDKKKNKKNKKNEDDEDEWNKIITSNLRGPKIKGEKEQKNETK